MQTLLLSVRSFANRHDELPAFHAASIVLSFVIASLCTTGLFLLAILAHWCLDLVKYRDTRGLSWSSAAIQALRENIVTVTVLFAGLTASIYLHPSLGLVAGLSGLALAEASILRALAITVPKFTALQQLSQSMGALLLSPDDDGRSFAPREQCFLAVLVTLVMLLIVAPVTLDIPLSAYLLVLRVELTPGVL